MVSATYLIYAIRNIPLLLLPWLILGSIVPGMIALYFIYTNFNRWIFSRPRLYSLTRSTRGHTEFIEVYVETEMVVQYDEAEDWEMPRLVPIVEDD